HPIYPTEEGALNIRVIFLFAAAWMVIFTIPLILFVPEVPRSAIQTKRESIIDSYKALIAQIQKLRRENPDALKFLLASAVYRDGLAGAGVFAFASLGAITYWIFGLALCLFVGPAQASSRTFVARFAPANREGEIFGLYQTTGRAASFLSPTLWALSLMAASAAGFANATVFGIIGIMIVLAAGLFWLLRVHPLSSYSP
ncbi:MAG: hypothetical protein EB057_05120, partial [Microbacteriaceae bacterium]|nr:hypothetical protein [Microbacteriaceae bacterium]